MNNTSGRRRSAVAELTRSERWQTVALGPLLIAAFTLAPLGFAGPLSQWQGIDLAEASAQITAVLRIAADQYYDILGVIATVLVALAAATNLGVAERFLGERARTVVLACVSTSAVLIAFLAAAMILVAIAEPRKVVEAIVAGFVAWVCFLVGQTVTGAATADERAKSARAQWKLRKRIAAEYGITRHAHVDRPAVAVAEVAVWLLPMLVWIVVGSAAVGASLGPLWVARVLPVVVIVHLGVSLITLGWRGTADLSESLKTRRRVRGAMTGLGLLASALISTAMMPILPTLGVTLIAYTALYACLLPLFSSRFSVTAKIEHAATARSLRRYHTQKMLRESFVRKRRAAKLESS